jgi:hypothetical protein
MGFIPIVAQIYGMDKNAEIFQFWVCCSEIDFGHFKNVHFAKTHRGPN